MIKIKDTNTNTFPSLCVWLCCLASKYMQMKAGTLMASRETTQCLTCAFFRDGLELVGFEAGFQVANRGGDQSHGVPRAVLCLLQHDRS